MTLKMIQINVEHGRFLNALVDFLRKENPDVITMQEVTTGGENFYDDKKGSLFVLLRYALDMEGVFTPSFQLSDDPKASFGNVIFTRGAIRSHEIVWVRPHCALTKTQRWDEQYWPLFPRNILDAEIRLQGVNFHVLSVHGAWHKEPVDTPENVRQAKLIAAHVEKLGGAPFLLGGDLNMTPNTRVIQTIDAVARNAMRNSGITSTLHPVLHRTAKEKPNGLLVDYIYTSPHFTVEKIDAPVVDVSDHLPVRAMLSYDEV